MTIIDGAANGMNAGRVHPAPENRQRNAACHGLLLDQCLHGHINEDT
jgi:hypothetical protein